MRAFAKFTHYLHDIHPASRAKNPVNARDFLRNFYPISLSETTRGYQHLTIAFHISKFAKHAEGLFLGWADKAAGVDSVGVTVINVDVGVSVGVGVLVTSGVAVAVGWIVAVGVASPAAVNIWLTTSPKLPINPRSRPL